jgi:hypothetical protein
MMRSALAWLRNTLSRARPSLARDDATPPDPHPGSPGGDRAGFQPTRQISGSEMVQWTPSSEA